MKKTVCISILLILFLVDVSSSQTVPKITPEEFTRLSTSMSEQGGRFSSDNWVSNELSYLKVLSTIDSLQIKGGVYIGVGADQNFTYLFAAQPDLAFIVDIRRQNRIQQLIYKIFFEIAETPMEFLSFLFSVPLDKNTAPGKNASIEEIINYIRNTQKSRQMLDNTEKELIRILREKYNYPLTETDSYSIGRILASFYNYGLNITYIGNNLSWYPTYLRLLIMEENGEKLNPFNSQEKYNYLRQLHLDNKVIPVTGDFAGTKALNMIGEYLMEHGLTVTAFYVSNVEQYLFNVYTIWDNWLKNVKALPITDRSVFIRWTHEQRLGTAHRTRLQWIKVFIKNYDKGLYYSYKDVKDIGYINN
ncbi:hypothetical protein ACFL7D_10515 [candidate division KSB1 bacterium]